jgi:hypothetical protein
VSRGKRKREMRLTSGSQPEERRADMALTSGPGMA